MFNPGFDSHNVLTMRMALAGPRFAKTSVVAQLIRAGAERIDTLPGVEVAGATCCVPLEGGFGLPFIVLGRPLDGPAHCGGAFNPISPTYFSAFKIPVIRGRAFSDRDDGGAPGVAIINQTMARRFWPTGDPLSDRIHIGKDFAPGQDLLDRQIIGIVGDVHGRLNRDPQPTMYVPWAQLPDAHSAGLLEVASLAWIVRTRVEPHSLSRTVENELRLASGGLPVARIRTMDEVVAQSTARANFNMLLLTILAGSALLLASIGIYGLMAYSVQQRTQEIGIRLALGADAHRVRNLMIRHGVRVALVGVAIGVISAFGLTRVLASFLFGVTARDPIVFATVPLVLAAIALVAVWVPARRAARVDPVVALRYE